MKCVAIYAASCAKWFRFRESLTHLRLCISSYSLSFLTGHQNQRNVRVTSHHEQPNGIARTDVYAVLASHPIGGVKLAGGCSGFCGKKSPQFMIVVAGLGLEHCFGWRTSCGRMFGPWRIIVRITGITTRCKKNALYRKRKDTFATDLRHEQCMHSGFWTLLYVFLSE